MRLRGRLFYAYAHLNARSAARQLKSSDVVVVDRLHAWILSVLLNVPHVVVDTKYEKISAVITVLAARRTGDADRGPGRLSGEGACTRRRETTAVIMEALAGTRLASVVIPVLNAAPMLERLLVQLDRQTLRDRMTVIVVDNGSSDGSLDVARRYSDVAVNEPRPGIPYAKQRGLEEVDTPFVLSIDADCLPRDSGWAEVLVGGLAAADAGVLGISGPVLPMPSDDRWSQREELTPASGVDESGRIPMSSAAIMPTGLRSCSLSADIPCSRFAAEDAALGIRARAQGYSFTWAPEAVVLHENPSVGEDTPERCDRWVAIMPIWSNGPVRW